LRIFNKMINIYLILDSISTRVIQFMITSNNKKRKLVFYETLAKYFNILSYRLF